jgi:hypothetical protein
VSHDRGLTFAASFSLGPPATRETQLVSPSTSVPLRRKGAASAKWSPSGANSNIAWVPIRRATVTDVAPPLVCLRRRDARDRHGHEHSGTRRTRRWPSGDASGIVYGHVRYPNRRLGPTRVRERSERRRNVATVAGTSVPPRPERVLVRPVAVPYSRERGRMRSGNHRGAGLRLECRACSRSDPFFLALRGHFGTATTVTFPPIRTATPPPSSPACPFQPADPGNGHEHEPAASSSSLAFVTFVPPSECILTSAIVRATLELLSHMVLETHPRAPRPWADGGPWVVWHAEDPAVDVSARFASMAWPTGSSGAASHRDPSADGGTEARARGDETIHAWSLAEQADGGAPPRTGTLDAKLEKTLALQKTPAVFVSCAAFSRETSWRRWRRWCWRDWRANGGAHGRTAGITALVET